jgi:hypothetical protein
VRATTLCICSPTLPPPALYLHLLGTGACAPPSPSSTSWLTTQPPPKPAQHQAGQVLSMLPPPTQVALQDVTSSSRVSPPRAACPLGVLWRLELPVGGQGLGMSCSCSWQGLGELLVGIAGQVCLQPGSPATSQHRCSGGMWAACACEGH